MAELTPQNESRAQESLFRKAGKTAVHRRGSGCSPGCRLVPLGSDGGHRSMLGLDVCVGLLDGHQDGGLRQLGLSAGRRLPLRGEQLAGAEAGLGG